MIRFYNGEMCRAISQDEVEGIRALAQSGDAVACFKMGRLVYAAHDLSASEDYLITAQRWLAKAQQGGVVEADVALAIMMLNGEIEPYNPRKAIGMLEEALKKENEFAAYQQLVNLIFGRFGYKKDIDLAEHMLDQLLERSTNPWFYDLKGEVLQERGRFADSEPWLIKAIEGGVTYSYFSLALAQGYDNNFELRDWDAMIETFRKGADEGNTSCLCYFAYNQMDWYKTLGQEQTEERDECRSNIVQVLEECVDGFNGTAAELLGDIYREGLCDVPVDYETAWQCYLRGADYYCLGSCYAKMYDMVLQGQVDRGTNRQEYLEQFAVFGARMRDAHMQDETVRMYRNGRLTRYAAEIEMFHLPEVERRSSENGTLD